MVIDEPPVLPARSPPIRHAAHRGRKGFDLFPSLQGVLTRRLVLPAVARRGGVSPGAFAEELDQWSAMAEADQRTVQWSRFRDLVHHAVAHAPHYRHAFAAAGLGPEDLRSPEDLTRLPVLTKDALRSQPSSAFLTAPPDGARWIQTAGSSGQPVRVAWSSEAYARMLLRRDGCLATLGLRLGDREARFWGRPAGGWRARAVDFVGNRQVFTFMATEDHARAAEARDLVRWRPDYLYGYASLILRAARHWLDAGLPPPPWRAVVATAETLLPAQRDLVERAFGVPVVMEYGCSETDIIAFGCSAGRYHVLTNHVLVEAVTFAEDAAPEVVVTDLDNHLMPLIRYRLGDHVVLGDDPCPCGRPGRTLLEIAGRTTRRTIHLPGGREVHAVALAHLFEDLAGRGWAFDQFKVWQEKRQALRVVVAGAADPRRDEFAAAVREGIAERVAPGLEVEVVFGEIPAVPGEKFSYFVALPDQDSGRNS